ncbi:MAG: Tm-1-like ATP-binding domain-containing protein [Gemmataceae bacterium]
MPPVVYAVSTMDTKGSELEFVAQCLQNAGVTVRKIDVGTLGEPTRPSDVSRDYVASFHPDGAAAILNETDRGKAVSAMSVALTAFFQHEHKNGRVAGAIGLGGTGGTALIAPAMRALPIGIPKVLVSTVAAGDVRAYVGSSDLIMVPSIVDVAGLNSVSRRILANAAHALAGMVSHTVSSEGERPAIGMTMFGVTTPCVEAVRSALEKQGFDCLVFHATGTGGKAMESLVEAGFIRGVLDITTTEVADEIVGGIFPAGPQRFDAIINARIPYVVSLGALDMVNFAAKDTVPERFHNRKLHVHNAQITLMRTTPDENRQCARWIAGKLNRSQSPVSLLIPEKSVSLLDAPGMPFEDPEADRALFDELESAIEKTQERTIRRLPEAINSPCFAEELVNEFLRLWKSGTQAM